MKVNVISNNKRGYKKLYKKIRATLSLIVLFVFMFQCSVGALSPFTDMDEQSSYYESVMELVEDGVVSGYSDNTFRPNNFITIREALIIVEKTFGNTEGLPLWNEWEEFKDNGTIYQTNWNIDCTLFQNDFLGAVTHEIGSHFILASNHIETIDPIIYGYAPEHPFYFAPEYFNNIKAKGYKSDKHSSSLMSRGEFCDLVVWAKSNIHNLPTNRVDFPITYSLFSGKSLSQAEKLSYESYYLSAFMKAPKWVLNYYARNNGTIKIVQDSEWTHDPHAAAVYSHSGSSPVIYTRSTDAQSAIHELGHFVYDASNVSFPDAIFNAEKDKLTIVTWSDYCKTNKSEYFAEAFWAYCLFPAGVEKHAPQTYAFLNELCTKLEAEYK